MHRSRSLAVALLALVSLAPLAACGSDDSEGSGSTATTTSVAPSTSKPTASTTSPPGSETTTPAPSDVALAIWPFADTTTTYDDPVQVASDFARTYLEFTSPVAGEFQAGDSRSGEVAIRPNDRATTTTTVLVRQLGPDSTWWVIGAVNENLQLESPDRDASISSPVTLSGESTAFEATVNVEVRQDGSLTPLATDFVMGGANGEMGPFSKAIPFDTPTAAAGAIVLKTLSAEDGSVMEASVLRIRFA